MAECVYHVMNGKHPDRWVLKHPSVALGVCSAEHYFLQDSDPQFTEDYMKGTGTIHQFTDPNEVEIPFITCQPEKILYYEILKRACWDLHYDIDPMWRRSALLWFRLGLEGKEQEEAVVSFLQCVEILELGETEIEYLRVKYHEAEKVPCKEEEEYKLQKERQPYRIATSALLARERLPECSSEPAVCGVFRNS